MPPIFQEPRVHWGAIERGGGEKIKNKIIINNNNKLNEYCVLVLLSNGSVRTRQSQRGILLQNDR
jgi:hypothetical protein